MAEYNDYPIELCAHKARQLNMNGINTLQKFTCAKCGSRQTMEQPNVFYATGTCEACKNVTTITHCNYIATTLSAELLKSLMNK